MRFTTVTTFCFIFLISFFSCKDAENEEKLETDVTSAGEEVNITEDDRPMSRSYILAKMREEGELSSFLEEMQSSGLEDEFEDREGPFTFFVPSNAAYDRIPAKELKTEDSVEARKELRDNMRYYMAEGELTVDYLKEKIRASENGRYEFRTALGEKLWASEKDGKIILTDVLGNQAAIVTSTMDEYYGVYHVLDNILRPGETSPDID